MQAHTCHKCTCLVHVHGHEKSWKQVGAKIVNEASRTGISTYLDSTCLNFIILLPIVNYTVRHEKLQREKDGNKAHTFFFCSNKAQNGWILNL